MHVSYVYAWNKDNLYILPFSPIWIWYKTPQEIEHLWPSAYRELIGRIVYEALTIHLAKCYQHV